MLTRFIRAIKRFVDYEVFLFKEWYYVNSDWFYYQRQRVVNFGPGVLSLLKRRCHENRLLLVGWYLRTHQEATERRKLVIDSVRVTTKDLKARFHVARYKLASYIHPDLRWYFWVWVGRFQALWYWLVILRINANRKVFFPIRKYMRRFWF